MMIKLALRQAQLDPLRTLLTALAPGSVIAVILVMEGFEQGQYYQLEQIVLNRKADLIATQSGVTNFIAVRSSIPQLSRVEVEIAPDLSTFPLLSYMLIELEPAANLNRVALQIEAIVPSVDVVTPKQLAENDINMG